MGKLKLARALFKKDQLVSRERRDAQHFLRICVGQGLQVCVIYHLYSPYSRGWNLIHQDQHRELAKGLRCGGDAISVPRPFPQQWEVTTELCPCKHDGKIQESFSYGSLWNSSPYATWEVLNLSGV